LYLTLSVVFFLALKIAVGPGTEHVASAFHRSLNEAHRSVTIIDIGSLKAITNPDGSFTCSLPKWLCNHIEEQVLQPTGELDRRVSSTPRELFAHLSTAVFLLLPLFAFYLKLAFFERSYGEHFLFAMHVHSFWFFALLVLLLPVPVWVELTVLGYLLVYSVMALHAVYASPWWKSALKALALAIAYVASLLTATMLIVLWTIVV
jgi:hypothetical protein